MNKQVTPMSSFQTGKRLFRQLKNQKGRLLLVGIGILIYTFVNVYSPFYSIQVMNSLVEAINSGSSFTIIWDSLGKELIIFSLLYLFQAVAYFFEVYMMASVAESLCYELRKQISIKIHKLPLKFFDSNQPGEILSRVTSDLDKVSETLQTGLLRLVSSIGTIIGSLIFMFYLRWELTLIFLSFMVVSMIVTQIVARKNLQCASERQEAIAKLTAISEEYFTGRDIIKAYNEENESILKMENQTENVKKITKKADFLTNCVNPLIRMLSRFAQVVILLIACHWMLLESHGMNFGVVQAFFQYIGICSEPMTEASYMVNSLQAAIASANRTFEFLDAEEEKADTTSPYEIERAEGEIAFHHVSFGYKEDKLLMKDISFTAHKGEKIAIVGATGAGKTTLVNLLMRFYEINSGEITLDGISTQKLTREGLRKNFGMVLQDTWLYNGTIADNIAYGKKDATREEIIQAAKMAKIDYLIRTLPQGYDTVLENDAAILSVGQKQLLTIARVFLCNPPVLILDEATSSVDTRTEAEIGKAMEHLMKNRTSFVIAHRLSTIRDANNILFMENGNIIEQGNHETLLSKGGAYAALYNSQFA